MIFSYIILGISAVFLILCIIGTVTESAPHKKAGIRNFFRCITVSLREINLVWTIVISAMLLLISLKTKADDTLITLCAVGIFLIGLVILCHFRIFGMAKSKKRRNKRKLLS